MSALFLLLACPAPERAPERVAPPRVAEPRERPAPVAPSLAVQVTRDGVPEPELTVTWGGSDDGSAQSDAGGWVFFDEVRPGILPVLVHSVLRPHAFQVQTRTDETRLLQVELTEHEREADLRPVFGLRLAAREDGVHVLHVHPDGPAHGHLERGDVLTEVEGVSLVGLDQREAVARIGGSIGVDRSFTVKRGDDPFVQILAPVARARFRQDVDP